MKTLPYKRIPRWRKKIITKWANAFGKLYKIKTPNQNG